jgi:hypothetical protein
MNDAGGYAVFFFPQALEALGDAIKPYLHDGPGGLHVLCGEVDTAGALVEMTLAGSTPEGRHADLELMVPIGMVRMIVSAHGDGETFGFGPRIAPVLMATLPPVGPGAPPPHAPSQTLPETPGGTTTETPAKP